MPGPSYPAPPDPASPPRGVLHSNPMDYAWGANGLDAIITQVRLATQRLWGQEAGLVKQWVLLCSPRVPCVLFSAV